MLEPLKPNDNKPTNITINLMYKILRNLTLAVFRIMSAVTLFASFFAYNFGREMGVVSCIAGAVTLFGFSIMIDAANRYLNKCESSADKTAKP